MLDVRIFRSDLWRENVIFELFSTFWVFFVKFYCVGADLFINNQHFWIKMEEASKSLPMSFDHNQQVLQCSLKNRNVKIGIQCSHLKFLESSVPYLGSVIWRRGQLGIAKTTAVQCITLFLAALRKFLRGIFSGPKKSFILFTRYELRFISKTSKNSACHETEANQNLYKKISVLGLQQ